MMPARRSRACPGPDPGPQAPRRRRHHRDALRTGGACSRRSGPRWRAGSAEIDTPCMPWLRHLFADGGYAGPKLRGALDRIGKWTLEIVKRSDTAKSLPPRRRGLRSSSPDDGSSNAPLHGSGAADGWQKTGKNPSPPARRGSTSPISDSQPGGSQGLGRLEGVSSQALRA